MAPWKEGRQQSPEASWPTSLSLLTCRQGPGGERWASRFHRGSPADQLPCLPSFTLRLKFLISRWKNFTQLPSLSELSRQLWLRKPPHPSASQCSEKENDPTATGQSSLDTRGFLLRGIGKRAASLCRHPGSVLGSLATHRGGTLLGLLLTAATRKLSALLVTHEAEAADPPPSGAVHPAGFLPRCVRGRGGCVRGSLGADAGISFAETKHADECPR